MRHYTGESCIYLCVMCYSAILGLPSIEWNGRCAQEGSQDVQRSLRSRAGGESTTGTAQGTAPDTSSPRGRGRMLRSRSGTASGKPEHNCRLLWCSGAPPE